MPARLVLAFGGCLLALLLVASPVQASHDGAALPLLHEDEAAQEGLAWLAEETVYGDGCVDPYGDGDTCYPGAAKWLLVAVSSLGEDPTTWPSQQDSVLGWMLDHAEDLHDNEYETCSNPEQCKQKRTMSLLKSVLAFRAAGEDPSAIPLPGGDTRDVVAELLDTFQNGQFGSSGLVNDDIWALIALHSVGYEGHEVEDAADTVARAQGPDGGFGYSGATPSTDTTAAAVMALAPLDRAGTVDDALSFLADAQIREGDTRACWGDSPSDDTGNTGSTSWALQALLAAREAPSAWAVDDRTPAGCLLTFQDTSGAFNNSPGGGAGFPPTKNALPALSWVPYGSLRQPNEPLTVNDEATVGQQHRATLPGGVLRIGEAAVAEHTWTPEEAGARVFHGFTWDPPRPASLVVEAEQADDASSSGSSGTGSGGQDASSSGSGTSSSADAGEPPTVRVAAPDEAERNVSFHLTVEGQAGEDPVTALRLQVGDDQPTPWQPAGSFEPTATQLGEVTLQAWARDAEGRVSEPAQATVLVVDATPRIGIEGPHVVDRTRPATFHADASDPDGGPPNVTWTGPEGDRAEGANATFTFDEPGEHMITAHATDPAANVANATWTVHARNQAPANLTVEPGELAANSSEVVHASAQDPEGDDLRVAWRFPGEAEPSSWGRQLHLETGPPGERELVVNVTDTHGAWTSARVTIPVREDPDEANTSSIEDVTSNVEDTQPEPPIPTPEDPPATVELPATIEADADESQLLHLAATSPSGPVVNVTVALGGPLPVQGTEQATAILPSLPAGEYELAARAADQAGWGPWTNATLLVHPAEGDGAALEPAGGASAARATPLGAIAASLALALAARGRRR